MEKSCFEVPKNCFKNLRCLLVELKLYSFQKDVNYFIIDLKGRNLVVTSCYLELVKNNSAQINDRFATFTFQFQIHVLIQ